MNSRVHGTDKKNIVVITFNNDFLQLMNIKNIESQLYLFIYLFIYRT